MLDRFTGYKRLLALAALNGGGASIIERTAIGNPLTFLTDLAKPLKSLLIPFTPVQSGTGDPSPENIRSILPWNGLTVVHTTENLLTINRPSGQESNGIKWDVIKQDNKTVAVHAEGERTTTNPFFNLNYVNGTTLSIPAGKYKIHGGSAEIRFQVFIINANGQEQSLGADTGSGLEITIPADAKASWCRLHVNTDNKVNKTVYPVITAVDDQYSVIPVSFPSPVYGGTLDVVSGVLTVEWARVKISDLSWDYQTQWGGRFRAQLRGKAGTSSVEANLLCSIYNASAITTNDNIICGYGEGNSGLVYIKDGRYTDKDDFVNGVGDEYIYYPLATPQEIQLTPAQITALVGDNTIWSDDDGQLTAVYLLTESFGDEHPISGGLGSGLLGGGFGSGSGEPDEPGEPDQPDEPAEPDQTGE